MLRLCNRRMISLTIGRRNRCAGIIVQLIGRPNRIGIPFQFPKELFNTIGFCQVFSNLDLKSNYHQLSLLAGDQVKIAFWGVDHDGKDQLYH